MEKKKIRVLICDDESHIRKLLRVIIEGIGGDVVGEAENGVDAVDLCKKLNPHLVLLDINMPKMNGDKALEQMVKFNPKILVIMLTAQDSAQTVTSMLDLGAYNYILKGNSAPVIQELIVGSWNEYIAEIRARES